MIWRSNSARRGLFAPRTPSGPTASRSDAAAAKPKSPLTSSAATRGEAYVQKGDIARAKAQLEAIEKICGRGCEEYTDLAEAIADPSRL